jgi:hypothetical protein
VEYYYESKNMCLKCEYGFFIKSNTCQPNPEDCAVFDSDHNKCNACLTPILPNKEGVCDNNELNGKCSANCEICNHYFCLKCKNDFALNIQLECVPTIKNCLYAKQENFLYHSQQINNTRKFILQNYLNHITENDRVKDFNSLSSENNFYIFSTNENLNIYNEEIEFFNYLQKKKINFSSEKSQKLTVPIKECLICYEGYFVDFLGNCISSENERENRFIYLILVASSFLIFLLIGVFCINIFSKEQTESNYTSDFSQADNYINIE